MLNFNKPIGYPMLQHQLEPIHNGQFVYHFIHNDTPEVGEEAITGWGRRDAELVSIDKVEPVRSKHHHEPVMKYTCTFKLVKRDR